MQALLKNVILSTWSTNTNNTTAIWWCTTLSGVPSAAGRCCQKVLVGPVCDRLKQIIGEVVDEHDWQIISLMIHPDHVHLFKRTNPYTLPSDSPRFIKGRSSHDLREEFPHLRTLLSLWTRSFF
jgi:REP element-mobilizing transposase RayT